MKRLFFASIALSFFSAPAFAYSIAPGCAVPPATIAGPTWNVTNAASLAAAVKSAAGNGGTIVLAGGNYGDFSLVNAPNSSWLKFSSVPGQTPIFTTISVNHTNEVIFDGPTVQSLNGTADNNGWALVSVGDGGAAAPTTNIVFANMTVNSLAAVDTLTQAQMNTEFRPAGFYIVGTADTSGVNVGHNGEPYTTCISAENNHISNVLNGATLYANNILFTGNQIDHFGQDGIDHGANNFTITGNKIHDNMAVVSPLGGAAAIQGWLGVQPAGGAPNYFSNGLIDSNVITRQTDKNLPLPTPLQGIVAGNIYSDWTNVTVTNNVIVTQVTCNGINLASVHGSKIANNTVAEESSAANGNCYGVGDTGILAGSGNGQIPGSHSDTTLIFGNIAPTLQSFSGASILNNAGTSNYDIAPNSAGIQILGQRKNGGDQATLNNAGHGTDQIPQAQFINFVPGSVSTLSLILYTFDLHLSPHSWIAAACNNYPAVDDPRVCKNSWVAVSVPGTSPALDIEGNPRFGDGVTLCTVPVPGAYSFPVPCTSTGSGPVPLPPPPPAPPPPLQKF